MPKTGSALAVIEAKYVKELQARRARLACELATIDERLGTFGKLAAPARRVTRHRRRRRSGAPLRTFVARVLSKASGALRVREIEQAVRRAGYKTRAKDLYNAITAVLAQSREVRKTGRGRYALKSAGKAAKSA